MALRRNKKNPDERGFSRNDQKKMLAADTPFVIKEAYNTIRTSLLFTQKGESCPVFVVTSPDANNGKTINTINLAISFAQMGKRTLIIDSDMRNPTVHRMFNIPVTNGRADRQHHCIQNQCGKFIHSLLRQNPAQSGGVAGQLQNGSATEFCQGALRLRVYRHPAD